MKNAARYSLVVLKSVKAEDHMIQKIDGPEHFPQSRPLSQGCAYPLFKVERVSTEVLRRRAIVRG